MKIKKTNFANRTKSALLTLAIAASLPAMIASADRDSYSEWFDSNAVLSHGSDIQNSYKQEANSYWTFNESPTNIPSVKEAESSFSFNKENLIRSENNAKDSNEWWISKTETNKESKEETYNFPSRLTKEEYSFSNADYAKLYSAKIKNDNYFQKDYSKKSEFSKEVGNVYQEWDLKRHFYEATNKTEELKMLDAEMSAKITSLKAQNKANNYGLDELFSADASSTNEELLSAWQEAKKTAIEYEEAAANKEIKSANDTYLRNFYTAQAKKDAERKADEEARRKALNIYLANRSVK